MKPNTRSILLAAALGLWTITATAHHIAGTVLCTDVTPSTPLQGVTVNVQGTQTTLTGTTDAAGQFSIPLPVITDTYIVTITPPAGLTVTSPASGQYSVTIFANGVGGPDTFEDANFDLSGCGTLECPDCVDPDLGLGAAAGCTVLELGTAKVSITGPAGGILGHICIAPNGSLAMSGDEYVTGSVFLGPGAKFSNSSHGTVNVVQNVDLTGEISAAYAAAANAASLPCTQSYAKLDGKDVTTIVGGAGINVICVGDVVLGGKQITLSGPAGAKFILNVTGKFVLTGGGAGPQIRVAGGVQSKDVLYNIIGTGADVAFSGGGGGENCCAAVVDGTLLAPYRKINLSPGLVNGQIISGKDINIVSGSSVRCPPCPGVN